MGIFAPFPSSSAFHSAEVMAFITVPGGFACPCRLFSSEARVAAADGCRDGHWSEGGFSSAPIGLGSGSFTAWLL